jgi:hypothetical protein
MQELLGAAVSGWMDVSQYKFLQCGTCGVHHAIPAAMYDTLQKDGGYWHCPNGHQRGFRTGTEKAEQEKIRRERDQLKQDTARLHERIQEEKSRAEKAEKKLAASTKRAMAGVCPCCNRTFSNVQRHMQTKHPNVREAS